VVDCAAIAPEGFRLTIAMLTGELSQEELDRSSLLLRNIDRLSLDLQAEIAADLLGESFPPRLFATSSVPLEELAARGKFYPPLATALSTLLIQLPSLPERFDDLPLLAQMIVERHNRIEEHQLSGITPETLDALAHYGWPGGIAELLYLLLQACHTTFDTHVQIHNLPPAIRLAEDAAHAMPPRDETIALDYYLADIERELIERAMRRAKGNKARAARLLGLTRPRLYRRLELLGLEKREEADHESQD